MNRKLLLLTGAALSAGCYTAPCDLPELAVLWGPPPSAGFTVPGLTAANGFAQGQLTCAQAGVTAVAVFVGGAEQLCDPPGASYCGAASGPNSTRWACDIDGIVGPLPSGGSYDVIVDGYDAAGVIKYSNTEVGGALGNTGDVVDALRCGQTAVGLSARGLDGSIDLDWTPTTCLSVDTSMQFRLAGVDTGSRPFTAVQVGPGSPTYVCAGTTTIPVTSSAPAGVYSLLMDEWDPNGGNNRSTYDAVGGVCSPQLFAHAGNDVLQASLSLLPTAGTVCVQ
jgi:hypothetical protein